jgi:hypothetical protein
LTSPSSQLRLRRARAAFFAAFHACNDAACQDCDRIKALVDDLEQAAREAEREAGRLPPLHRNT